MSGYHSSNKASLVIKNGWIVGEFYNQESARSAVYYLASRDQVTRTFLQKLFASVTQQYLSCDGTIMNASTRPSVTTLRLMNADTDQPIMALTNGATITLANLPTRRLNVRAESSPLDGGERTLWA